MAVSVLDRFLEAVSDAERFRAMLPIERRLQRQIATAFRKQGAAFLRRFLTLRSQVAPLQEAGLGDWEPMFSQAEIETLQLFRQPIDDAAARAIAAGARAVIADLSLDLAFDLKHPRAIAYLQDHAATQVRLINATTREQLRTILTHAADEGWSYQRTAKAISDRFRDFAGAPLRPAPQHIRSRAELVAITEVGDAYEEGGQLMVRQLQDQGLTMEKAWHDVGDARVDAGCRANTRAGWIPLERAFPTGHQRPLEHPGCRCTCLYRRKPDEPGGSGSTPRATASSAPGAPGGSGGTPPGGTPPPTRPGPTPPTPLQRLFRRHGIARAAWDAVEQMGDDLRGLTIRNRIEYAGAINARTGRQHGGLIVGKADEVDIAPHLNSMRVGQRYAELHTHPNSSSFSPDDLKIFVGHPLAQLLVAHGPDGTWHLVSRFPSHVPSLNLDDLEAFWWREVRRVRGTYQALFDQGAISADEANREIIHEATAGTARRFGLRYDRFHP